MMLSTLICLPNDGEMVIILKFTISPMQSVRPRLGPTIKSLHCRRPTIKKKVPSMSGVLLSV